MNGGIKMSNIIICDKCKKELEKTSYQLSMHHWTLIQSGSREGDCTLHMDLCRKCYYEIVRKLK